ncbi:MAG: hypothetical protein Q8J97_10310 [Flavobacteriaceae bacterium]|nr:hypothetical protein [Flavobacteriaceae bacterium]
MAHPPQDSHGTKGTFMDAFQYGLSRALSNREVKPISVPKLREYCHPVLAYVVAFF